MNNSISFTRINNDTNGNPRYVCHFLNILNEKEQNLNINEKYSLAIKKAKSIGGKKYHNKKYGGGLVFQSHNIETLEKSILELARID